MARQCPVIIVSGFLGAGKTRLIETLADSAVISALTSGVTSGRQDPPDPNAEAIVVEGDGLRHPGAEAAEHEGLGDVRIVTVVDAVNFLACLDDRAIAGLIAAQIQSADCVVLARSDLTDPAEAMAKIAAITPAPVIDNMKAPATLGAILDCGGAAAARAGAAVPDLSNSFTRWTYSGAGMLTPEAVSRFLANRPRGAYRIFGQVISPSNGIAVEVVGRLRQTNGIPLPQATTMTAFGAKAAFSPRAMDQAFTEAIVDASYSIGRIACR